MGFEYRVFWGGWKFSQLMGFEPILYLNKYYINYLTITGNFWYNIGVGKNSYSKIVVIITLKYFEVNRKKILDSLRYKGVFCIYNI